MRIVVIDTSFLWKNYKHVLEKYKDMLLVICFESKQETVDYECLECQVENEKERIDLFGHSKIRIDLFPSLKNKLLEKLSGYKEMLFLADYDLLSLYPVVSLTDERKDIKMHLCAVSPFKFDMEKYMEYQKILGDLSELTSLLYIDSNKYLNISSETSLMDTLKQIETQYISALPTVVNSVENLDGNFYFDLSSGKYVDRCLV